MKNLLIILFALIPITLSAESSHEANRTPAVLDLPREVPSGENAHLYDAFISDFYK